MTELIHGGKLLGANRIVKGGIAYQRPQLTGELASYAVGDDRWNLENGDYFYTPPANPISIAQLDLTAPAFLETLKDNNIFENKIRFTNTSGGTVWDGSDGSEIAYAIDHVTGLGWSNDEVRFGNWALTVSGVTAQIKNGWSDWRVPNWNEYYSMRDFSTGFTNGVFFNQAGASWSSNIRKGAPTQSYYMSGNHAVIYNNSSNFYARYQVRNHFN